MTDEDKPQFKHAHITGQAMRDHWGPIVDRIAAETADWRDAWIYDLITENERLIKAGDGDVGLIHWQGERIEQLEAALREIARLRTDLSGDFSLGSKQSDIARAALGDTK